jgi:hypothetical protein
MAGASSSIFIVHHFFVSLNSETKLAHKTMQKRADFHPERIFLIVFGLAVLFRSRNGGNGLDLIAVGFGFVSAA